MRSRVASRSCGAGSARGRRALPSGRAALYAGHEAPSAGCAGGCGAGLPRAQARRAPRAGRAPYHPGGRRYMPDMRRLRRAAPGLRLLVITLLVLAGAVGPGAGQTGPAASGRAVVLTLEGAVTPASADYLVRGIAEAGAEGASLVVIRMDT